MPPNWVDIERCSICKVLGVTECNNCDSCVQCWGEETVLPETLIVIEGIKGEGMPLSFAADACRKLLKELSDDRHK